MRIAPRTGQLLHAWIDIENPPQAQYLVPLARALERRGAAVFVTARDYGMTFDLLRAGGVQFEPVGRHFGASRAAKVAGTLRRVRDLRRILRGRPRPNAVLSVSRSASLAARSLGILSFAVCDYEYVNLSVFRLSGTYVVHPDVISAEAFRARGISQARLIPFHGIKEDITFADLDVASIPAYTFPELEGSSLLRVLFRPPAEESHYHRAESSALGGLTLGRLARDANVAVIFSPRYDWQVESLESIEWTVPPIVLRDAVPFVSLLKAVDVVISGGGTMTREAAYLGIPAVSVFRGAAGEVDRHLEATGRLTIVRSADELFVLDLRGLVRVQPMFTNRSVPDEIADAVVHAIRVERRDSRRVARSRQPSDPS
jgi:predicted glycosyltransferase